MTTAHFQRSSKACTLLLLGAAMASMSALAATQTEAAEIRARYQQERAICLSGQSNQDRATCLREAGAAQAQAIRGNLDDGPAAYRRNARQRCDSLPDADRKDCAARMRGLGTTSGSVAAGGVYRELVTLEILVPIVTPPDKDQQDPPPK